ncbi:GntR family transcriptional regulator [Kaustia mangrovi]|uniref:GntR family transcriptional regulator n=1 Tax=Kaustia mangrovi TaxID=2593653 RepID=A0A7S8HBR9_9HYPH|nr:GntR family transcriptional regulator [Kaustia mangrovi]QPC42972.1 GntR family transcriptional regulator [Kaustia mangrovi]
MSARETILRKTLHEELAALLRNMIVEGELRPGERIPEQALCERFGVSRTPLREALMVLSAEKLVHLSPNRGASVVRITCDDVSEIFPLMATLEGYAGELACERIESAGLDRLRLLVDELSDRHRAADVQGYVEFCRRIAEAVMEESRNATLSHQYQVLLVRVHNIYMRSLEVMVERMPEHWQAALDGRQAMLEALENRDGPTYARLARNYVCYQVETVREALKAHEPELSS